MRPRLYTPPPHALPRVLYSMQINSSTNKSKLGRSKCARNLKVSRQTNNKEFMKE